MKLIGHISTPHATPIKHMVIFCVSSPKVVKKEREVICQISKNRTDQNEKRYKDYKSLFEILKEKSKKLFYMKKLADCGNNVKKTWDKIKVIGKSKLINNGLPKMMVIDGCEIFDQNCT